MGALLLLVGLAFLGGCQGLSAGGSQQQTGDLGFGSTSLNFGSVAAGTSRTLTITVTNPASQTVTISSAAMTANYFSLTATNFPLTIAAGESATLSVKFTPNGAGSFSGTATVTSDAPNAITNISLAGMGTETDNGQLSLTPASDAFGNVAVGGMQSQTVTLTNNGTASVNISQASISGSGFVMSGISAPMVLGASQSTNFTVGFAPQATGSAGGTVTITSDAPNPTLTMALTGTGIPASPIVSSPASLSFGTVPVGTKQTLSETLTNTGSSSIMISQTAIAGGSGFGMTGITAPMTLAGGQSATFSVSFDPTAPGAVSGNITITSTASNPTLTIPISGSGAPAGPLASNPASLSFGSVPVGNKQTLSATLTNTGGSSVTISQVSIVGGSGFSMNGLTAPVTLTGGQSTSFSASFAPAAAGTVTGTITITSTASNSTLTIPLSGTGGTAGPLTSNPASVSFGSVPVGSKQTLSETVTNSGTSSLTISQIAIAGGSGFGMTGITAPVTLTGGQSATFSVSFDPTAPGAVSGNITITSTAANSTLVIPLSGTGVAAGALGSNPTSLSFGSVQVGVKQTLSETVTNTGGSNITISAVAASGSGFSLSGIAAPVTLTAGQSTSFSVSFTPAATGAVSGNVTVTSNASNPTLTIPLSGTGVAPGALGSNPTSLSFGSVQIAHTQTLAETVTNTGASSVTISQVGVSGTGFSVSGISTPVTLTAGQSTSFSVSFTPPVSGAQSGNVTVTSNASNPTLTIPLSGTGTSPGTLVSNPISLSFGSVPVATTQTLSETITNVGGGSVTISQVVASGTGFSVSGISTPVTLTAGQSTSFSVSFTPPSAGAVTGDVTITSNASDPSFIVPLSGTGTGTAGQLTVSPTTLALGSVAVGDSGTGSGTLTASGANVTVTGASSTSSAFTVSGLALPVTIQAGQSASFTVTFTPLTTGSASGTITFTSNAQPTTTTETVTGTGTPAPTHTVALSWNASTSSDVSGYNIYRAVYTSSCGSFSKINSTLNASMAYTDSAVSNGTSYCYATTAVDSSNAESAYSNIVSNLQIP